MAVKLKFYIDDVVKEYNTAVEQAMKEAVLIVEADAKRNAPVDTGRLRASITNEVRKITRDVIEGRVGTNVEYAVKKMLSLMATWELLNRAKSVKTLIF